MNTANKETTPATEVVTEIVTQEDKGVQAYDIDGFLEKRREFIEKVNKVMVPGSDYHTINGKKSLAKGGAEKIASIFSWTAVFDRDTAMADAFQDVKGLIGYVCNLYKDSAQVGQGRGAATLGGNKNDPNKTVKMAQKSAFIDAVLRASGLSDFFTQDLGPEDEGASYDHTGEQPQKDIPASEAQMKLINDLIQQKGIERDKLYDMGYDINNLTGGRNGTASELITTLKQVRPNRFDDMGLGSDFTSNTAKRLIADLDSCDNLQSYNKIMQEVKVAHENKRLTLEDQGNIKAAAHDSLTRLQGKKKVDFSQMTTEQIAETINF